MARKAITLDELPVWGSRDTHKYYKLHPLPEDFEPKYPVNDEINSKVTIWMRGDSSRLACDAIVNAANSHLAPGGGICGVIHSAAGPELAEECYKIGHTPTGQAAITKGYNLPAKHVIHAVGPIGENKEALESAYKSTLAYIDGEEVRSVAFCCISTGIYGYPIRPATHVALETVRQWLEDEENRKKTDRIVFVVFMPKDVEVYWKLAQFYFPIGPHQPADDEKEEEEKEEKKEEKEEEKEE